MDQFRSDASNRNLDRLQVIPLSSNTEKLYPCETYVTLNSARSKAIADQITTVAKQRLQTLLGVLSADDMTSVERAIGIQLGLRR